MLLFWLLSVGIVAGWGGNDSPFELDEAIEVWMERAGANPAYLAERGAEFFEVGKSLTSCDSTLLGYALMLEAHNLEPDAYVRPALDTVACPPVGVRIPQTEATIAYHNGQFDLAQKWFERALHAAKEEPLRASLMQSLGSSAYMKNDLETALKWYAASTAFGVELLSSISLNNLASVNLALDNPEETLKWGSLAEQRLIEEFADGLDTRTFEKRRDLILLNTCLAALALDDRQALQSNFSRMSLADFFPGMAIEFLFAANMFAWYFDDPYPVSLHADAFSEYILRDSIAAVERLGPMLILLEPWQSAWEAEQTANLPAWLALKALPAEHLPPLEHEMDIQPAQGSSKVLLGWGMAGAVFLLGAGAFIRTGGLKRPVQLSASEHLQALRARLYSGEHAPEENATDRLESIHRTVPLKLARQLSAQFTHRELEVLRGIAEGERAKDTAERLGVGSKSIYMTRTDIRKKLGMASTDRLEDVLAEFIKSAATK